MQHELESLERRITTLEDEELEVMARLEDAQRSLADLTHQLGDADDRRVRLEKARDARYADIDAELTQIAALRGPVAEGFRPTCCRSTTGSARPRTASAPLRSGRFSAAAAC